MLGLFAIGLLTGEDINVVGTGSGMNILQEIADDFNELNPGMQVMVPPSIGSGGAVLSVGSEMEALGRVARNIKKKEEKYGLSLVEIASNPIIFYSNKSNKIDSLSHEQVLDIYSGKITNWSEVGGTNLPIEVVRREKGDSSLDILEKTMNGFSGDRICKDATFKYSDQDAVSYLESTPGTIAFGTFGNGKTADVDVLSLDGIYPDRPEYPCKGMLALIFKEGRVSPGAEAFLKFASSEMAKPAIIRAYGVPVE